MKMKPTKLTNRLGLVTVSIALGFGGMALTSCESDSPAEEVAEELDEAADADDAEEAVEEVEEAAEEVAE